MATTPVTTSNGAILPSLGVGSGIDIDGLVTQLVAADTSAANSRIARQSKQVGTEISAIGQLKGALATFQAALSSLNTQSDFQAKAATSADNTIYTASATSAAAPGTYQVEVVGLAQANQLLSNPVGGGVGTVVGTGSLVLSLGSSSFTVSIDNTHNTLAGVRDAINSASDNVGISATVVNGASGAQLVLTSAQTGAANTIAVAASSGDGLNRFVYNPTTTTNYTRLQAAQDSEINVAGVNHHSATNTVTDAIDGVTLNLLAQKPASQIRLTIANDTGTVESRVQAFVSSYNSLKGVLTSLGGFNSDSQVAGPLLGDALVTTVESQLRRGLSDTVASASGAFNSLASIGVTTNKNGTLSLDQSKLHTALTTNFNAVSTVFGASDGVASRLSSFLDQQLSSTGGIALRNQTLASQQKSITNDQAIVTAQARQLTLRFQAQFTAMDTLLSQMQQTSSFLTQQFTNLQKQLTSGF